MLSENVWLCASIQIALFATLQATQAPGDGSSECQNPPFIKTPFPSNIAPLMDSYDYLDLRGGLWSTLDVDGDMRTVSVLTVVRYVCTARRSPIPLSFHQITSPCSGTRQVIHRVVRSSFRAATLIHNKTTG